MRNQLKMKFHMHTSGYGVREFFLTYRQTCTLPSNRVNLTCLQIKLRSVNYFGVHKQATRSEYCIVFNHIIHAIVLPRCFSRFMHAVHFGSRHKKLYAWKKRVCDVANTLTSRLFAIGCKVLADSLTSLRDHSYSFNKYYYTII